MELSTSPSRSKEYYEYPSSSSSNSVDDLADKSVNSNNDKYDDDDEFHNNNNHINANDSDEEDVTEFMDHVHLTRSNHSDEDEIDDDDDDDDEAFSDSSSMDSYSRNHYYGHFGDFSMLPQLTLEVIAQRLSSDHFRNVLVLTGAGVSVAAGIPDFRTPGTGLYDNLQKYNLPHPEAVFDINFYRNNPGPFLSLAKEIWPGMSSRPTLTHHFIKLLQQKGQLLRIYTQNIDGLEVLAGVDPDKVIECHGHFRSAHCIDCKAVYDGEECKRKFINESSVPKCPSCGGYIKPSIVFFGEGLPEVFASHLRRDLMQCDFLLVMGTSLKVQPVALIPQLVPPHCPRLLLNREIVGDFEEGGSWRDVFISGDCDDRYV